MSERRLFTVESVPPFAEPPNHLSSNPKRLTTELIEMGVHILYPSIIDVRGRGHGPQVSVRELVNLCDSGQSTDGSSIPPYGGIINSDVRIRVDPKAVYRLPGYPGVAIGFGNAMDPVTHQPNPGCFRTRLQQLLDEARNEHDLEFLSGFEIELFLRKKEGKLEDPWVKGVGLRSNYQRWPDKDPLFDVVYQMLAGLAEAGMHVTVAHTEVAPWQIEINNAAADPVRAAQIYMVMRVGLKRLAEAIGYKAIFEGKPRENVNGTGLHTHLSAKLTRTSKNALFNSDRSFTELGGKFFGGMFACAGALTFLGNLEQRDYLRLNRPGFEAPNLNAMGWANRTCSFRLTGNSHDSYHVEFRVPCPGSTHAFGLLIGMIEAGLLGIKNNVEPPKLVDYNAYKQRDGLESLPGSRAEAQQAFVESEVMRQAFTEQQFKALAELSEED